TEHHEFRSHMETSVGVRRPRSRRAAFVGEGRIPKRIELIVRRQRPRVSHYTIKYARCQASSNTVIASSYARSPAGNSHAYRRAAPQADSLHPADTPK